MAYTFDVCELRDRRNIQLTGEPQTESVSTIFTTSYQVIVGTDASDDIKNISPISVAQAPGIPEINKDTYFFGGEVLPYCVCRNKNATQDRSQPARWVVVCVYRSFGISLEPVEPPGDISGFGPYEEPSMGESSRYLWHDYETPSKPYVTPVETFWDEPLMERLPIFTLKITQYEAYIPYSEMIERKLRCNSTSYRGTDPYTWLITDIEAVETVVQLAGGPSTVAQVTYTLEYNDSKADDGTSIGWRAERALITWYYYDSLNPPNNEKEPFVDKKLKTETTGFITIDGLRKTEPGPGGVVLPDYIYYKPQPVIDYNGFLQI